MIIIGTCQFHQMRLFLIVVICIIVQMCLSASIEKRDATSTELIETDIEHYQNDLKTLAGIETGAIDNFVNNFQKFQENYTDIEIINDTVKTDISKINKTIFEQFLTNDQENETSEETDSTTPKGITQKDLNELKTGLSKVLTPTQTVHAINILRGFREGATAKEKEAALVDLYISVLNTAFNIANVTQHSTYI